MLCTNDEHLLSSYLAPCEKHYGTSLVTAARGVIDIFDIPCADLVSVDELVDIVIKKCSNNLGAYSFPWFNTSAWHFIF